MTEQEKINQQLQRQIDMQGGRIDALAVKVDALSDKIDLYVEESRTARARQDEDMREIRASLEGVGKHVQNLTVAAMVGVGTSVIAVVMVGTVVYSIFTR
ncbi:MAG: hypothetical protein SR2Q5_03755 [Quinella sp. 2Q5]|nr:hypothetical protein [Quinella sp. 2Q5]